jgi:PAS domain-containing protein
VQLKFDWLIVLENLRRGITVTDKTLEGPKSPRIVYVNAVWLQMTGCGRDEIANQTPHMLQGKHPDRAGVGSLKQKLLADPNNADALRFFSVLDEWKSARKYP